MIKKSDSKGLNILVLSNEILQVGMSAASRTKAYAKALAIAGNNVKILTPFGFPTRTQSNIPQKIKFDAGFEYEFLSYMSKHPLDGRNMVWAGLLFFLFRLLGFIKLYYLLLFNRKSYEVVFVYEFPILQSLLIRIFSCGKPLFYELCEVPIPNQPNNQLFKRRLREYLNLFWADGFLVISDNLFFYANNLRRNFKMLKVPILVDEDVQIFDKIGAEIKSPSIMHIGTLSPNKDFILYIIHAYGLAMQKLPDDKKFHFYLTNQLESAVNHEEISKAIKKYQIEDWVHFIGYQQENHLHSLLVKTNLAVVYKNNNEINHFGFPTKIGNYLTAGLPIVISPVGEMQKYIKDGYNGFVVELDNLDGLSDVFVNFFLNPDSFSFMKQNAKDTAIREFSLAKQGERISDFFKNSLNK